MSTISPIHPEGSHPETEVDRKLSQLERRILRLELLAETRQMDRDTRLKELAEPTRILDYSPEVFESLEARLRANGIDGVITRE